MTLRANGDPGWYIRISHLGPEDGHINSIVIVAQHNNYIKTERSAFDSIAIVSRPLFDRIAVFIAENQGKKSWKKSEGQVVSEFGAFEIKDCNYDDSGRSFAWMLTKAQALHAFQELSGLARKEGSAPKLLDELNLRIGIIEKSFDDGHKH